VLTVPGRRGGAWWMECKITTLFGRDALQESDDHGKPNLRHRKMCSKKIKFHVNNFCVFVSSPVS